jgi:methyl-accepting chemotaxis protein
LIDLGSFAEAIVKFIDGCQNISEHTESTRYQNEQMLITSSKMIQQINRTAEENQQILKCILKADERILKADERILKADERILKADERILKADERILKADEHILKADERIEQISNDIKDLNKYLKVITDLTDVIQQVLVHFIQSKESKQQIFFLFSFILSLSFIFFVVSVVVRDVKACYQTCV